MKKVGAVRRVSWHMVSMGFPFGIGSSGGDIVVGTCACATDGDLVGRREIAPRIGGRVGLGEGNAKEFGVCSHDGDGLGDVPREIPKADECAFWAGDCGLAPNSTLRVVRGVAYGDPSK